MERKQTYDSKMDKYTQTQEQMNTPKHANIETHEHTETRKYSLWNR